MQDSEESAGKAHNIQLTQLKLASAIKVGINSVKLSDITMARNDFLANFSQPLIGNFTPGNGKKVEVEGVAFFDRMHNQTGRALPSGLELHPVVSFKVIP